MAYILAFDQGTTSSRSIIFDQDGDIVAISQQELPQIYPRPGWVEHDPMEIWNCQLHTAEQVLLRAGIGVREIAAIGITNQRETAIIWDRKTGEPIHNGIVWQDRRTADLCDTVRYDHQDVIRQKTGLEVDAYFSASKIKWLLDNVPDARQRAEAGRLAFGTVDTWLIWKLSNGKAHITDPSNASRTMLFNINRLEWDQELLDIFAIPYMLLPNVKPSDDIYGDVDIISSRLNGVKIAGDAGDQQAATFGQACFEPGSVKSTYGTGCFLLQNIGNKPATSKNHLLSTVGWMLGNKTTYCLEGSVFVGGAVVQWLRDSLGIIETAVGVEVLAASVPDNGGVYFVPAFAGLGTPHWDQKARGTIIGLTRGTGKAHLARAALESMAFQTADLITAINADSGRPIDELRVDGGACRNDLLMQFQADILQIPVVRPKITETTALGAAYLAGLAVGFWRTTAQLAEHWKVDRVFEPQISPSTAAQLLERWHEAVERSLRWIK